MPFKKHKETKKVTVSQEHNDASFPSGKHIGFLSGKEIIDLNQQFDDNSKDFFDSDDVRIVKLKQKLKEEQHENEMLKLKLRYFIDQHPEIDDIEQLVDILGTTPQPTDEI